MTLEVFHWKVKGICASLMCRKKKKKKKKATEQVEEEKSEDQAGESKPAHKDDEASQKKRADDLWALFLSDVGPRPKAGSAGSPSCSTAQVKVVR